MKLSYTQIRNRHGALVSIGNLKLPRKVCVAIARNITALEKEIAEYQKQKNDIAVRYAAKDASGKFVLDDSKKNFTFSSVSDYDGFIQEVSDLDETEINVEIMKFNESELEQCDNSERYDILTPTQEALIEWMIDYGNGKEE